MATPMTTRLFFLSPCSAIRSGISSRQGEVQVPGDAWYGAQTARAVANFPISGRRPDNDFVLAHVRIKLAAARANCQPGWLSEEKRDAIAAACEKILAGAHDDEFVVD